MSKLHHIVFFRLHENVDATVCAEAVQQLTALGVGQPNIEHWAINESLDTRKGRIIIEEGLFTSVQALEAFRVSPRHIEVGNFMSQIADWWVGDYAVQE